MIRPSSMGQPASFQTAQPAWLRCATLWLGLLCLWTQLSGSLHLALVQHVRCEKHGQWVHAEAAHAEPDKAPLAETFEPETARVAVARVFVGDTEDHGHDHCSEFFERRSPVLPSDPVVCKAATWSAMPGHNAPTVPFAHSGSLYALAPKTSPPWA